MYMRPGVWNAMATSISATAPSGSGRRRITFSALARQQYTPYQRPGFSVCARLDDVSTGAPDERRQMPVPGNKKGAESARIAHVLFCRQHRRMLA
jgi:hypothetical protein